MTPARFAHLACSLMAAFSLILLLYGITLALATQGARPPAQLLAKLGIVSTILLVLGFDPHHATRHLLATNHTEIPE